MWGWLSEPSRRKRGAARMRLRRLGVGSSRWGCRCDLLEWLRWRLLWQLEQNGSAAYHAALSAFQSDVHARVDEFKTLSVATCRAGHIAERRDLFDEPMQPCRADAAL
jgi:hypothetical protein